MEVILLERVAKLGQMGEVVRVKDGFARNFLLPQGKALRATKDNRSKFEGMKVAARGAQSRTEERGREHRRQAQRQELHRAAPGVRNRPAVRLGLGARHRGACWPMAASRSTRNQIALHAPIKMIGLHTVPVALHPEVEVDDHDQCRAQCRRGRAPGARRGRDAAPRGGRRGGEPPRPRRRHSSRSPKTPPTIRARARTRRPTE